ncbi:response regulator transcription factor [Sphingomonas sp. MMS24-J13]|uniref:response regulator transcription factor n=1 Tax=Sphingomonas sp. MMS24-J13 TaxID=3238686 RepID=UPI00384CAD40
MKILLVEDDDDAAGQIDRDLRAFGHAITRLGATADAGLAKGGDYDAVILDRRLPDGDGVDLLRRWRRAGFDTPVILLTALSGVSSRIEGLDAGADDYIIKPVDNAELEARLRALRRRRRSDGGADASRLTCGTVAIDRLRREASRNGRRLILKPREMRLLEELMLGAGEIVTRAHLLSAVWHLNFNPRTKLIESQMSHLRDKLTEHGLPDPIETIRGVGYQFRTDV